MTFSRFPYRLFIVSYIGLALLGLISCSPVTPNVADLVVLNADIWTMKKQSPKAEAMAIAQGRILAVGSKQDIQSYINNDTRIIDAEYHTVVPGFNDAHMHPMMVAPGSINLGYPAVVTMADLLGALSKRAQQLPAGEWLLAWNYNDKLLGDHPTRVQLDSVSTVHPIMITHSSGHVKSANSLAYEGAGITAATENPEGGAYDRDDNGEIKGVCREMPACEMLFSERFPEPERELSTSIEQLRETVKELHSFGITSIGDAYVTPALTLVYLLAINDSYPIRANLMFIDEQVGFAKWMHRLDSIGLIDSLSDDRIRMSTVKIFHGNSLSGATCWLYEPYANRPDYFGIEPARDQSSLNAIVKEVHDSGMQVAIHANGDREIDMVLEAIELAVNDNPKPDHRHRIEHASIMNTGLLKRAKNLGVVLALHSYVYEHGAKMEAYGEWRFPWMHVNRSALEAGVPIAGNSDYPISSAHVMTRLRSLMTRMSTEGRVYGPQQILSAEQAIHSYTAGSAYASFEETEKGQLTPGHYADFVMLSDNPALVDAEIVNDIKVLMTVVGGKVVFEQ